MPRIFRRVLPVALVANIALAVQFAFVASGTKAW